MGTIQQSKFMGLPRTQLGRWAAGLGILFVVIFLLRTNDIWIPIPGILLMAIGIIAGLLVLAALLWKRERSWLLWLMLLPGLFAIFFTFGELLYPH